MFELTGKTAVVTGAGSGIGEAIAVLFDRQGACVAVLDIEEAAARRTVDAIRSRDGQGEAWACDVGDASRVGAVLSEIEKRFSRIDILVNNAGIAHVGDISHTAEEDLDRVYRVNVKGVYLCARAAIDRMVRQGGGVILNMSSITAKIGVPERFAYSMSKGAVHTMTMSIAVDYVKKGIRCNCICPARVHTPFVDGFVSRSYPGQEEEMLRKLSEYQPIGRMGKPEEVAALALYLCSDEASFVTGAAYDIDGGVVTT
jgi:NAD(P)-dependent dehydrogenase (short-subunit alcohol dehydrogenase family)